jgi:hypothetical protein
MALRLREHLSGELVLGAPQQPSEKLNTALMVEGG